MHMVKGIFLLVLALGLVACAGKPDSGDNYSSQVEPTLMHPSVETCNSLMKRAGPIQLTGYASGWTVLVESSQVWHVDVGGHTTRVLNETIPVGTYCKLTVVNTLLDSVVMNQNPGCLPGWNINCN